MWKISSAMSSWSSVGYNYYTSHRRLWTAPTDTQGWLQQIFVTIPNANQASNTLEYARDLRKSNDPYIRDQYL